ncbi:MAG: HAD hydrolase family protein, partial [Gammaproteobacteria bacterium]|nr:HAD hydrolase family protein [Gammaproteobacteria bacterium]
DGKIYITDTGSEYKAFNSRDGIGIKMLRKTGVEVAIISGRYSAAVEYRLHALGITHIYQKQDDKSIAFNKLKLDLNVSDEEIAYLGDDIPDLITMQTASLGITVADGDSFVLKHADLVTKAPGGYGAVREACEFIMQAQGTLEQMQQQYLTQPNE